MHYFHHNVTQNKMDIKRTIYTNFKNADAVSKRYFESCQLSIINDSILTLVKKYFFSKKDDAFVINGNVRLISILCLLKLVSLNTRGRIIAVDLVLRLPLGVKSKLAAFVRRLLFSGVDHYIHYFKNLSGYAKHYWISPKKSSYVPFKSNIYDLAHRHTLNEKEDYVFSAGRSMRDYTTLVEAARIHKLPTAILYTSETDWLLHGTEFDRRNLPENVVLLKDDGTQEGWIEGLKKARITVIPTLKKSICASGIGTYLDAMALGKPVIISKGPGADDLLNDSLALFAEPECPTDLAQKIEQLWFDSEAAKRIAANGRVYALSLGDERALISRVLTQCLRVV